MSDKKTYYKLDDIGIVGKQEKKSASSIKYHLKKTGDVLRQARAASCLADSKSYTKKAS
jgi:hypothetical protein